MSARKLIIFQVFDKKRPRTSLPAGKGRAFEVLKIKEFTFVNDCFQNESNEVFGVFLQRLDRDLAKLYGVETKQLKRQVRRNIDRFPKDFMFELSKDELEKLRSHFGTSRWGGVRYASMVFTEQGVAMLSSVLSSPTAIKVNIQIIRVFTKMRKKLTDNLNIKLEIEKIKKKLSHQNKNIELVFSYLDELLKKKETQKPRRKTGYKK